MSLAIVLLLGMLSMYIAVRIYTLYGAAEGTVWEKLYATAKGSKTIFVHMITVAAAGFFEVVSYVTQFWGDNNIQTYIQKFMTPEVFGIVAAVVAALGIWARLRTLDK